MTLLGDDEGCLSGAVTVGVNILLSNLAPEDGPNLDTSYV